MADAAIEPGRVLAGKYRLGERLGEGGMGAVYRAEHLILQAPVAIKVIEREVADEGTKARFVREAQAAAALRSPHVVQILDYGTEGDFPFMVMELLEGETLAKRIKRKQRLSPQETIWVLTHVSRAVVKAHELGIVHRDLKPDNVFLVRNEEDEIAKVLDFGVAKIEATSLTGDSHTRTGSLLGTPYYMSPEQAQGNKAIDHRSDLWALGVIAFECLTGRRPFASDGLGDLVLQICIRDLPVPSDVAPVPIGFNDWFAKAVAREPDGRFQSAKELIDALREALGVGDSLSEPQIIVANTPLSVPGLDSTLPPDEDDALTTTPENRFVDAAAATVAEVGTLHPLGRVGGSNFGAPGAIGESESSLSRSLHGAEHREPLAKPRAGSAPRQSSRAGLLFTVGSGALIVGVLLAVFALRDRPGFRVGEIEGPTQAPSKRGAPSSSSAVRAVDTTAAERLPAQPRVQRETVSTNASRTNETPESPRVIDGRSILESYPDAEIVGEGGEELPAPATEDLAGDPKGTTEPKPPESKSAAEAKPAAEPKPAPEPKPSAEAGGVQEPKTPAPPEAKPEPGAAESAQGSTPSEKIPALPPREKKPDAAEPEPSPPAPREEATGELTARGHREPQPLSAPLDQARD